MKAVLVTGATSGIGFDITKTLASKDICVYATYRKEVDFKKLNSIKNVIPIKLDVRDIKTMDQLKERIKKEGNGLYGLINNAGVGGLGMFVNWTPEEIRDIFEINVFGPMNLTNKLLPLLLKSSGRIINIGSQGGMITKKYFGPYSMTKHALEAYTDALSEELKPYGISVSIVQPGGIVSKIGENSKKEIIARFKRAESPFNTEAEMVIQSLTSPTVNDPNEPESENNRKISQPNIVTEAVLDALFSDTPKARYMVGTKWEGNRVLNRLFRKIIEENDNPVHNYPIEKLNEMLVKHYKDWYKTDY